MANELDQQADVLLGEELDLLFDLPPVTNRVVQLDFDGVPPQTPPNYTAPRPNICNCMLRVSRNRFQWQTAHHFVTLANIQASREVIESSLVQIPDNTLVYQTFREIVFVLDQLIAPFMQITHAFEDSLQNGQFTEQSFDFIHYVKLLCDVPQMGQLLGNATRHARGMARMLEGVSDAHVWNNQFTQGARRNCQMLLDLLNERLNLAAEIAQTMDQLNETT